MCRFSLKNHIINILSLLTVKWRANMGLPISMTDTKLQQTEKSISNGHKQKLQMIEILSCYVWFPYIYGWLTMWWQLISYIIFMLYIWHLSNVTINQDKPSSISTNPTWTLNANQFTTPVRVKWSYLMIMISDEGKLSSIGKLIQRAIILYFIKIFQL